MGFEMSLTYETATFAGVSALHMSIQIIYSLYFTLTEEWGYKIIEQNKVESQTFELIRFDKLEKVYNFVILIN